ncbi:LamG domain-containing protein [Streptomyces sp. NPDC092296]|uniref:LamG domain-containing protein n=1 Tax=Streptomyces sp. NPDC092296 TaxID=3366012 RepID=UPI00380DAC1B
MTLEQSVAPQRVRLADGSFTAPDATLVRRADGSIGPKAAVVDLSFSPGGDTDLVTLGEGGRSLGLGWRGVLPVPVLDGSSAVYPEVLPGVDLRVTASVEGFRQVLVVKSRQAAENPDLAKVSFPLRAEGLSVREGPGGGMTAVDPDGNAVFRAAAGEMWDSAERGEGGAGSVLSAAGSPAGGRAAVRSGRAASTGPLSAGDAGGDDRASDGEVTRDPADAPGDGAATAALPVRLDGGALDLVPDPDVLKGEDTVYPVYIDPATKLDDNREWTMLSSDGDKFWKFSGDKGVGHCGTYNGYYCGTGYTNRMFFEFSPSKLAGKHVLSATFRITETWSFSCDATTVDLSRTDNISSSTAWPGPKALDLMVDRTVSHGRGSACSPSQPAAPVEFKDNPSETNENLTSTVQAFADGKWSRLTLRLAAHDESDTNSWKRFDNDGTLSVTYVGIPALPGAIGILGDGVHRTCETNAASPETISDPTPTLTATAKTEPGGEAEAQLRITYDLDTKNADGTWSDTPEPASVVRPASGYAANNTALVLDWSTLAEGKTYRYRAWTVSHYSGGDLAGPSNGSTTGWCYFTVDTTAPKAPVITLKSPYTECLPNSCVPGGAPGTKASFTFAPNSSDGNVTGYTYKMSSGSAWSSVVTGAAGGSFVPPTGGTFTVQVRAKDSLGRLGATASKEFVVSEGSGPVGQWRFDEPSGTAGDSSTTNAALRRNATLGSTATRDPKGRRGTVEYDAYGNKLAQKVTDRALALDGTENSYAATAGPVIDTRASYTASAWVRLTAGGRNRTVLGQDGVHISPFFLSYESALNTWTLRLPNTDTNTSWTYTKITAPQPAVLGAWTHLTASYDSAAHQVRLYVNGRLAGSASFTTAWNATGPMQIGRVRWTDTNTDFFAGDIDEVRVWQRTLTDAEIAREADATLPNNDNAMALVGDWSLMPASGNAVSDGSGYGHGLALSGGAGLSEDGLTLDGSTGAAGTAGPVIDDSGSFTVTAEVALDQDRLALKPAGYTAQVFGERTATGSSWGIWYEQKAVNSNFGTVTGVWHFGRLNPDGSTTAFTSVKSNSEAEMGAAVRLVGTYDSVTGEASLYLGVVRQGAATAFTSAQGAGDLAAGKGFANGAWGHYLPGVITDLRIWAGAAADQDQIRRVVLGETDDT